MLLGQQLGRRHHHSLAAGAYRAHQSVERDQRLATANVADQHPIHLNGPRKVALNLVDGLELGRGRAERQSFEKFRGGLIARWQHDARAALSALLFARECELECEHFVDCERLLRRSRSFFQLL